MKPKEKTTTWQQPWGFPEAISIVLGLLAIGFGLEYLGGGTGIAPLSWPSNLYLMLFYVLALTGLHVLFAQKEWLTFLRSTENSISIIGAYLFMVILMGSFTQVDAMAKPIVSQLGLSHITSSWPFSLLNLYFLVVLGLVTLNRAWPFSLRNFAFFINHFGLWLAVFAGGMGAGDLLRMRMTINTADKRPTWYATHQRDTFELPLAVKLLDFNLQEYAPKMTLIDNKTGELIAGGGKSIIMLEDSIEAEMAGRHVRLLNYLPEASEVNGKFYRVNELGAAPAAEIEVRQGKQIDTAWISCGSFNRIPVSYRLDSLHALVMTVPEAKKFQSKVVVYTPQGDKDTLLIEVNKAQTINGYKLYQLSYDEQYGKWSETSILEVVYDPWQPVVYVGIFMMLAGGLYLFLRGRKAALPKTT